MGNAQDTEAGAADGATPGMLPGSSNLPYVPLNRTTTLDPQNALGYGVGAPYSPPLKYPKTLNSMMERDRYLQEVGMSIINPFLWWTLFAHEFTMMFHQYSLWNLDYFDGYGYNNYYAAGNQAYPHGINKYYDVNSWDGQLLIALDYTYILLWDMLSIFTLGIPVYRWIEIT